jgi:hypothetical protein
MSQTYVGTAAIAVLFLSSCADQMLSNDRIASATSGMLGLQPNQVAISDRRSDMNRTYYTATTNAGQQYTCLIAGGNAMTMGMTGAPICGKKGEGITLPPTASRP